jgi:hypothetical protein
MRGCTIEPVKRPRNTRPSKLKEWEAAVKSRVISFEVETAASSLHFAHWLPIRYQRGRNAFRYNLPETATRSGASESKRPS